MDYDGRHPFLEEYPLGKWAFDWRQLVFLFVSFPLSMFFKKRLLALKICWAKAVKIAQIHYFQDPIGHFESPLPPSLLGWYFVVNTTEKPCALSLTTCLKTEESFEGFGLKILIHLPVSFLCENSVNLSSSRYLSISVINAPYFASLPDVLPPPYIFPQIILAPILGTM